MVLSLHNYKFDKFPVLAITIIIRLKFNILRLCIEVNFIVIVDYVCYNIYYKRKEEEDNIY